MTLWSALILGLAGSLHCLGMCGPLALALPVGRQRSLWRRVLARTLYHIGRASTYALFGLAAGGLGQAFNLSGYQSQLSIVLGGLLILSCLYPSKWIPAFLYQRIYRPLKTALSLKLQKGSPADFYAVGMLNGLLPCGLVYAALAGASLQASSVRGAAYMALFGLGTVPLLLAVSLGSLSLQAPRLRPLLARLVPGIALFVGVLLVFRGLNLGIPYLSPNFSDTSSCCNP